MKIFGWTTEEVGAKATSGLAYIRVKLPLDELAQHGHEVAYAPMHTYEQGDADTFIGCRIAKSPPSRFWTHACGMPGGPFCVFETDDDNLGISPTNPAPYKFWGQPEHRTNYLNNMRVSHRIVTSTEYLRGLIADQTGHPDVVVARNTVPASMLEIPKPQNPRLVIGWAGGISHKPDWEWSRSGIRKALVQIKDSTVRMIGADYRPMMRLPADRTEHVDWFPDVGQYWHSPALGFDIGLAPLAPLAFNRSKSEIRLIEYAARGIPVVAQDYSVYSGFVKDGETGFLVKTQKEWTEAIIELADDAALRERMGAAARLMASQHTIQARWKEYEEAYTP